MSQTGKFLNLHPHMTSWAVYNVNGPYTSANKIGSLSPAQFGGISYNIIEDKGSDIYIIQTDSFGKCAIWAPIDNDSSITYERAFSNGGPGGSGGGTLLPGGNTGNGKYLNLHAHIPSWGVYNVNGPYTTANKIGSLAPAQFSGLSYSILEEKGGDVYIIQTDSFGRCAIWAPRDNDSSITTSPSYSNGNTSGGGIISGNGKYLNLHAHMQNWGVYNVNGPYTSANKIGSLAPAQFSGLSYSILEEKGGDVYIIQTDSFGRCAIWAPRDNDSSITTSPSYSNGNTSGGGSTGGSTGNGKYLNLHAHMPSWGVYNVNGPYTSANKIGSLAPAQFSGLSYSILEEKGGDVYIIQTDSFGRCAIWAPRDNDSSITTSPSYSNGNTSGGSTTPGGGGGVIIPGGLKVFIDPGHGGTDPGAGGNGLNEKDVVLSISKKLGVLLNQRGVSVQYSRTTDVAVSLEGRPQQANTWGANLFVSIHANASDTTARGTECYTTFSADSATKQLSSNVAKAISNKLSIPNRGHKEEIWRVLRLSNMPAILVETAFIDNSSDASLLNTRQDDFTLAIANEIYNYLSVSTTPPTPVADTLIYQSTRLVRKNEDGTVANDLKTNDFNKDQLLSIDTSFKYQLDSTSNPEILFKDFSSMSTDLFSTGEMETVILDMIDHFKSGSGDDYYSTILTKHVVAHKKTQEFVDSIKQGLIDQLILNRGNLRSLEYTEATKASNPLYKYIQANASRPVYNTIDDKRTGLTIAINDTWGNNVIVKNYSVNNKYFKGTMYFNIYDNFGLDLPDVDKIYRELAGFRAWFTLQHYKQFNGKYKPFVTQIKFTVPFEGYLN